MELVNHEVEKRFNLTVKYLKVVCSECLNSWGITVYTDDQDQSCEIRPVDLTCRECALREVANKK